VKLAELFALADEALRDMVGRIGPEQWEIETPKGLRFRKDDRTLRDLVRHFAYDDIWVPDTLAGKTAEEVGDKFDGDLLGTDPKGSFAKIVETAVGAVRELDDFDRIVHLSYGDYPARVYLEHIIIFRGFGTFDIARLIGLDATPPAALVEGLWEIVEPQAEELREFGAFGPRVEVPADAPLRDRLLGLSGREPAGSPK
jgi:uncharacterized protein (TIGR03086 family)